MITTTGPKGQVILKVRALISAQRTRPRTADPDVDTTIETLDEAGHWGWLRHAALWQEPQHLSEDEQLAAVLNELADPDHPEHNGTFWITKTLTRIGTLSSPWKKAVR